MAQGKPHHLQVRIFSHLHWLMRGSIPTVVSYKPRADDPEDGKDGCHRMQSSSSLPGSDENINNYFLKSALAG